MFLNLLLAKFHFTDFKYSMKVDFSKTNNISYTSRCPQIRDAQWVCHTVNTTFPHISTTRFLPAYKKLVYSEQELLPQNIKIFSMEKLLDALCFIKDKLKIERLESNPSAKDIETHRKISAAIKSILKLSYSRLRHNYTDSQNLNYILNMLSNAKMGNCYEEAKVAELTLLLNGITNACTATLENRFAGKINHNVCVFNRDGSKFNGVINKHTIVIDPWAGKVDFGSNMLKFYKNMCQDFFDMPQDKKLDITPLSQINLQETEIAKLKSEYQNLIFPNISHNFMVKN